MVWDVLLSSLLPQESGAELILSYVDPQCTYWFFIVCIVLVSMQAMLSIIRDRCFP